MITGLFLFLPACNPTEVPPPSAPIVAMVDDAEVTRDEFLAAFRNLHFGNELDEESEEGLKIKRRILEGLIEEKLILAEAGRRNLS
ncbi:MAG TPA: SurA N-terminal domain-containing protein, partial [Nitrospiria bacterium]